MVIRELGLKMYRYTGIDMVLLFITVFYILYKYQSMNKSISGYVSFKILYNIFIEDNSYTPL